MNQRTELLPGVFLRSVTSEKFKTGCFSVSLLRPHCRAEAAKNALLPSVLLRGCRSYPDILAISTRLDELYGATLGTLVRKKGEVQMTGFYADFIEDCFTPDHAPVFAGMVEFLRQVLLEPLLEDGCFRADAVRGEKVNLINAIEAQKDDKRSYAVQRLLQVMCPDEAYGVPRLGDAAEVEEITPALLYRHYRTILATSRVEIFYLGRQSHAQVCDAFRTALSALPRQACTPVGTAVRRSAAAPRCASEAMDVTQGKLAIGLRTGCTASDAGYPALLLLNVVLGSGVTSKLFLNVREKLSLCYYASSSLEKFKGVMLISSGIDFDCYDKARTAILHELEDCKNGRISSEELESARRMAVSSLLSMQDAPGRLEDYYTGMAITEHMPEPEALMQAVQTLTIEELAQAARNITLDTVFFLRGAEQ